MSLESRAATSPEVLKGFSEVYLSLATVVNVSTQMSNHRWGYGSNNGSSSHQFPTWKPDKTQIAGPQLKSF